MNKVRGIRGAIRLEENTKESILSATRTMLLAIVERNQVQVDDIASAFFTVTDDLDAEFPAYAARKLGWSMVPLLCAREMHVPDAMSRVIRVLLQVNSELEQKQIQHVYLGETKKLRPDLPGGEDDDRRDEN